MKRIVIPLSMIVGTILAIQMLSIVNDMTEKAKDGDITGVTEIIVNETVEEVKEKAVEPFRIALVYNPLMWILGFLGSLVGIEIVIR